MRWGERNGSEYLLRKIGNSETSLGPKNQGAEAAYAAFMSGREVNKKKLEGLEKRLDTMAPINRAMGLGRVPLIAARIARKCDEKGLLGRQLFIVGTNALYAYEALAGVQIGSDMIATEDIDLLHDSRQELGLAVDKSVRESGLIGLLQSLDKSFSLPHPRSFRASNKDGYLVDLIRPQSANAVMGKSAASISELPDDMAGAEIFGLEWLVNAPKLNAVALDERGYPVKLVVIDPRIFALHKVWVSNREDRDPLKRRRDKAQAVTAALIAKRFLGLTFDFPELSVQPQPLRDVAAGLLEQVAKLEASLQDGDLW
jgi:hypothetical protein